MPPGIVEPRCCCLPYSPIRLFFVLVVGGRKLPLDSFHGSQVTRPYSQVDAPTTEDQRYLAALLVPATPIAATAREDIVPITQNGSDGGTFL